MVKLLSWLLSLALPFALTGCGGGNRLLADASPSSSVLTLYRYDGETALWADLWNLEEEEALLDALSAVEAKKAPEWTPAMVTLPVYSLTIGRTDGWALEAVWSNGYWIDQEGAAYRFDCDWEELLSGCSLTDTRSQPSATGLSGFRYLVQQGDTWFPDRMAPAGELEAPEGVSMALAGREGDTLTVAYTNSGTERWEYGLDYDIQVLLDGAWYNVPCVPGNWVTLSVACIVSAGESREETYWLEPYGDLPAGQYRLAAEGMTVEFTVD